MLVFSLLSNGAVAKDGPRHHQRALERDRITALPGQPLGKVDKNFGRALFYWLIEAPITSSPHTKPLVLWLNGGPGCSYIAYGSSEEVGPFRVSPDGKTLMLSQFAWSKEANLLFLDSPAGVGFCYSNTSTHAEEVRFPQYKHRPFYLAGESYAGHFIPQLSLLITRGNKRIKYPIINFKGFLLGNPLLDDYLDNLGSFEYWYNHGLISESSYKACLNQSFLFPKGKCNDALFKAYWEFGVINPYDIYGSVCADLGTFFHSLTKPLPYRFRGNDECAVSYTKMYTNRPDVQKALHANITGSLPHPWTTCSDAVRSSLADSPRSMLPIIKELITSGVQIWVFSVDTDAVLPLTATSTPSMPSSSRLLQNGTLGMTIKKFNGSCNVLCGSNLVGGWTQVYEGPTYVTVRGAGHEVPLTCPRLALVLF
ncbi:hypothetical protein Cgig2_011081 [Carnegiea gigantea]|uniref:Carboxypeptidase n=1 Tax=Carnegiea gigantea TaxID=171969 RepID=A0A9Q1Q5K2_9CARY|nr:hypothetical protein Cgig2_011081 [Carnegiea gigantea]